MLPLFVKKVVGKSIGQKVNDDVRSSLREEGLEVKPVGQYSRPAIGAEQARSRYRETLGGLSGPGPPKGSLAVPENVERGGLRLSPWSAPGPPASGPAGELGCPATGRGLCRAELQSPRHSCSLTTPGP